LSLEFGTFGWGVASPLSACDKARKIRVWCWHFAPRPGQFSLFPPGFLPDTSSMLTPLWAVAGVLLFAGASFFFAVAESALFSLGTWQTRQLARRSPEAGGLVARLLAEPQNLLATIVLGNTFTNAAIVAIPLWRALSGGWSVAATVAILAAALALILVGCG